MENQKLAEKKNYNISSIEELMLDDISEVEQTIDLDINNHSYNRCSSYENNAASNTLT